MTAMHKHNEYSQHLKDMAFIDVFVLLFLFLIIVYFAPPIVYQTIGAPMSRPPSAPNSDAAPFGEVYEFPVWTKEAMTVTLCQDAIVRGSPRDDARELYVLPSGERVVMREQWQGWIMILPARWINSAGVCTQ
jgi:hypothetical protein